ncbi:MAG: hypothetical protein LQ338_004263 [Usnochroma carphineum]|nr:MAG: hypothetical protein LQ338_004263 [Usnochroma carphineum]
MNQDTDSLQHASAPKNNSDWKKWLLLGLSIAVPIISIFLCRFGYRKWKAYEERKRRQNHRRERSGDEQAAIELTSMSGETLHDSEGHGNGPREGSYRHRGHAAQPGPVDLQDEQQSFGRRVWGIVLRIGSDGKAHFAASSSFTGKYADSESRGTIKTYARQPTRALSLHDGDYPRKRIRMDTDGTAIEEHLNVPVDDPPTISPEDRVPSFSTPPSSSPPPDQTLFSDPVTSEGRGTESPFSSPPPPLASPEPATKKPAFSFLKRKRSLRSRDVSDSATEPLADIAPNIQSDPPRPTKKTRLTQMQIDLGGEIQKTCKTCGMEYIPSNKEDAALHREFHAMNLGGVDVGKKFLSSKDGGLKRAYPRNKKWLDEGEEMVMVDRKSPLWARNKVKKVLQVVNTELGAAEIEDEHLWAALMPKSDSLAQTSKKTKSEHGASDKAGERFKAFLHIERGKCVGFCLAEKISNARRVVDPAQGDNQNPTEKNALRSSSISTSADLDIALLGIARMWTSKSHRRQGIAAGLLETARGNFFYGMEVPKELIAFSQPTVSGVFVNTAMSGTNPFRRKDNVETSQPQRIPSTAGADLTGRAELRFPAIDTVDVPKTSKGKTVRIVSPHYSRSKEAYDSTVITSPPPQTPVASPPADTDAPSEEPSPVDPFSAQSDEGTSQDDDDNLRRNTIANAATSAVQDSPLLGTPVKPRKAPALQFGGDASTFASREQTEPSSSTPNVNRPHYDVDDFKRLLLTGERLPTEKNASVTTPSAQVQGLQLGDSNSNTDASSVSRQSIFEPQPEVHPESPSTSMDVPLSDDENHGLVQSLSNSGRPRPSVPPSRHGKLVKQKMPLTVAFESLSSSPPGPSLKSPSLAEPSLPPTPSTSRDLNKPLPPPPRTASPTSMEPSSLDATEAADKPSTPSTLQGRVVSKRNPPALPAARHHGQVRSRSSTTESNRSTSISEELSNFQASPTGASFTHAIDDVDQTPVANIYRLWFVRGGAASSTTTKTGFKSKSEQFYTVKAQRRVSRSERRACQKWFRCIIYPAALGTGDADGRKGRYS